MSIGRRPPIASHRNPRWLIVLALALSGASAGAEITLHEHVGYGGATRTLERDVRDLRELGWNDRASSFSIGSGVWELCRDADYGDCRTFRSDESDLTRLRGWNDSISSARRLRGAGGPRIEVFEHDDFEGRSRTFDQRVDDLGPQGWNDRISSVRVLSGRWQICRHAGYRECREIGGSERRLQGAWNDAISSLRPLRPFRDD